MARGRAGRFRHGRRSARRGGDRIDLARRQRRTARTARAADGADELLFRHQGDGLELAAASKGDGECRLGDRGELVRAACRVLRGVGDDARDARYIETVAKRGYRFIGEVKSGAEPLPPTEPVTDAPARAEGRRLRSGYITAAAILVILGGVWLGVRGPMPPVWLHTMPAPCWAATAASSGS